MEGGGDKVKGIPETLCLFIYKCLSYVFMKYVRKY